ncbi:hypothetical protein GP486_002895 [Trichoglossum hirsutum]|uniref:DUF7702 domain-containing protein n=1 Tax=Trichoglossum hirsutum TaxID=265104 RepID=A0A9P8RRP3_9PEZI|nr:hypothetical protein GP486_002895 [Trichoglossum hirsutum]
MGWLCILSFCSIRIVGSAVLLHAEAAHTASTSGFLLSNIGLSPLLIGAVGILHEARLARDPSLQRRREWFFVLKYHGLVSVGLILTIIGVVEMMNGKGGDSAKVLRKIGALIVLLCWSLLIVWVRLSMWSQQKVNAAAYADGTKLLYGVAAALPFLGFREIYAVCSAFITSPGFTSSLAAKVCLSVVPEMIVTIILAAAGIVTRDISKAIKKGDAESGGDYMAMPLRDGL